MVSRIWKGDFSQPNSTFPIRHDPSRPTKVDETDRSAHRCDWQPHIEAAALCEIEIIEFYCNMKYHNIPPITKPTRSHHFINFGGSLRIIPNWESWIWLGVAGVLVSRHNNILNLVDFLRQFLKNPDFVIFIIIFTVIDIVPEPYFLVKISFSIPQYCLEVGECAKYHFP